MQMPMVLRYVMEKRNKQFLTTKECMPLCKRYHNFYVIPRKPGVYVITNSINGRMYFGSTGDLQKRKNDHSRLLLKNKHWNRFLQNDFNVHKLSDYQFKILRIIDVFDREVILKNEQHYLDIYFGDKKQCYNLNALAESRLGTKDSDETKKMKSKMFSGEGNPMYGKHHSDETKELIGDANRGTYEEKYGLEKSIEMKKNLSATNIGRKMSTDFCENQSNRMLEVHKNKEVSEHMTRGIRNQDNNPMKDPIKAAKMNKNQQLNSPFNKKVNQIDKTTKLIINTFISIGEASRITGIDNSSISKVCLNKKGCLTTGGFIWEFA